jgi:NAD(P)-dependent dehydrogenase (short-subunit alcohol dehydrogenase family)
MWGGHEHAFKADVRNEAEIVRLVHEVREVFGDIDVLVVNEDLLSRADYWVMKVFNELFTPSLAPRASTESTL